MLRSAVSQRLIIEALSTSETSVKFCKTTRSNISEDSHLQNTVNFIHALLSAMYCSDVYLAQSGSLSFQLEYNRMLFNHS
jgi:hypothetical protein